MLFDRFKIIDTDTLEDTTVHIIKDKKTGVLYLQTVGDGGVGITPLLNSDGNVTIEK